MRGRALGSGRALLLVAAALTSALPSSAALASVGRRVAAGSRASAGTGLSSGPRAFRDDGFGSIRGVTLGPIESELQPGRGYGSEPFAETLDEVRAMGGNWISLTVFGRVWDLKSESIDLSFEAPFRETRDHVRRSVQMAHARGLRVFLVPHLWVESRGWRAELDPGSDEAWARWAKSYRHFVGAWAEVAEESGVDLFACGVELRSWVTTQRAASFLPVIRDVRAKYSGPITYAANWDDVDDTAILGELDVIGINAFYPLHWENDATTEQLRAGGERVAMQVKDLIRRYERPVVFTEFGYTARKDTAIRPWLWPEELGEVKLDQAAQAEAYAALLAGMADVPGFAGEFVWRMYADVADLSQEPDWGFSPWGKSSERVLRDAFRATQAEDLGGLDRGLLRRAR